VGGQNAVAPRERELRGARLPNLTEAGAQRE